MRAWHVNVNPILRFSKTVPLHVFEQPQSIVSIGTITGAIALLVE
jgi:hypothetical protein